MAMTRESSKQFSEPCVNRTICSKGRTKVTAVGETSKRRSGRNNWAAREWR